MTAEAICSSLRSLSRWDVPAALLEKVCQLVGRYGQLSLLPHPTLDSSLLLSSHEEALMQELISHRSLKEIGVRLISPKEAEVPSDRRGLLKQELTRLGYPVLDHAGYMDGQYLNILWRGEKSDSGGLEDSNGGSNDQRFQLRDYQRKAADSFRDVGGEGGNGSLSCLAVPGKRSLASLRCAICSARL